MGFIGRVIANGACIEVDLTASPSSIRSTAGQTTTGSPRLRAFRKKIRANDCATIPETPAPTNESGACSREEPEPKLWPATT